MFRRAGSGVLLRSGVGNNVLVTARDDSGAAEGMPQSHRADGPATGALPQQPWWRTALDSHRFVLLAIFVTVAYGSLGLSFLQRGNPPAAVAFLFLAVATLVAVASWLLPVHRYRSWAIVSLVILLAAPFVWLYTTR